MPITKDKKAALVKKYGGSDKNTGSLEVQIAILTEEIESLKPHFKVNKKDLHSQRGFIAKVERRKKYLSKLKETNADSYAKLIKELDLRK